MARTLIDKATRDSIKESKQLIEDVAKMQGNEAETRRRVERIFGSLMGYNVFKHITRERAVKGIADAEYVDFAITVEEGEDAKPAILVEIKKVAHDLHQKDLKQVVSYALDAGCEWVLLTNGREWRLYHVEFSRPPQTKLILGWNLLEDEPSKLVESFNMVGYRNVKKGMLDDLWNKTNVLQPNNILKSILHEESIRAIRKTLRELTGVLVSPEDLVSAIRHLLNEASLNQMQDIKISLPARKVRTARTITARASEGNSLDAIPQLPETGPAKGDNHQHNAE